VFTIKVTNYMKVRPADRSETVQEYYFSTKLKQIEEMRNSGADIINLGIGSPDMAPSANTIERLVEEVKKNNVHGYQSYNGALALRKAFADWYMRYFQVKLDPNDEILPLIGSKEGIMHITMAFINNGNEVLIPDPGYPTYTSVTNLAGGIVRKYDLKEENGWLPDFKILEGSDLGNIRLMWVNYPHMPSGAGASMKLFEKLVAFGHKHNILICNDNPYSFIMNKDYLSILAVDGGKEIALELNSLSKSHNMAGWRIGMVAGHRDYIKSILRIKSNMDSGMFLPLQLAAVEALSNSPEWFDKINSVYANRRKVAEEIMKVLGCRFNTEQQGLFLWGRIPQKNKSCESFTEELLQKAHLFITPGTVFGKNGEGYIRISLCCPEEILLKARDRASKFQLNRNSN
jgi:LL-diaminopimelate aminotransferase